MNKSLVVVSFELFLLVAPAFLLGALKHPEKKRDDGAVGFDYQDKDHSKDLTVIGVKGKALASLRYTIIVDPNPLAQPEVELSNNYPSDTYFSHLKDEKLVQIQLGAGRKKATFFLDKKYREYKGFKFDAALKKDEKTLTIKVYTKRNGGEENKGWKLIKKIKADKDLLIVFEFEK